MPIECHSAAPGQTLAIGQAVGRVLKGGELVELCGALGAGKTQFAKGLALGLGVDDNEPIVSPTFVLLREYVGRVAFYHCDAYRLHNVEELLDLGLEEALDAHDAVVAIEWADRFPDAVGTCTLRVTLSHVDEATRHILIEPRNPAIHTALRNSLARFLPRA